MTPHFSVIIPVYNAEATLKKCVDSVLGQQFANFEVILVDDGSKDGSFQICEEYARKDSRVIVIHKENGGVSSARNRGLEIAKGKWVTFVDSDDYINDTYLVLHEDKDVVFVSYRNVLDEKEKEGLSSACFTGCHLSDVVAKYGSDSMLRTPWAKFYRRDLIGNIRFPEDMKVGEDTCFVWRYLSRCQTYSLLPKSTYYVRLSAMTSEQKYGMKVDYAVKSLNRLKAAFELMAAHLGVKRSLFFSFVGYFKLVSSDEWIQNRALWYGNHSIKEFYRYVWPDLSIKQKVRLTMAYLLRK